jgi:amino acid adenylation domain-containing protein
MRVAPRIEDCVWRWAAATPDAVAITDRGRPVTYRDLAERADGIAERLKRCGASPEVKVALSAGRSAEMVAGIVGILRSGAAYLPIDPSYPEERRSFLLEDSQCPIVVTERRYLDRFERHAGSLIVLDDPSADRILPSATAAQSYDDPLAYIIYTSGSTGKPKGVEITQRNVIRLFEQTQHWYGFDQTDVFSLFHSFAFDVSVFEIWGALRHGGRLVVVPHELTRDPIAFRALVREEKVTVLSQTPSAFRMFLGADEILEPAGSDALRYVIFAGEALDLRLLRSWFDRHGDRKPVLVNMYGTTETTVHATYREIRLRDAGEARSLIGVPIPDLAIHLLDEQRQPVSAGQEGEIWIGGEGVGRGYRGRPELTAERFVDDFFREPGEGRLYRTGDLGRLCADGEVEYLGRIDHQVKLRGFRIELGEVEEALRTCAGVSDAVVTLRNDGGGEPFLAGYLVPISGGNLDVKVVRAHALRILPDYMCPAALMIIETLPLTTNGKLDRAALPVPRRFAPVEADPGGAEEQLAGGVEEEIAKAYREILGVSAVGSRSNFFGSGGTSLQGMQLALRIARDFGVTLPPGTVFRCPEVGQLAAAVEQARQSEATGTAAAPPDPPEDGGWFPLSPVQEQFWLLQRLTPESSVLHCPVACRITGPVDPRRLSDAIDRASMRHAMLRTVFGVQQGRPVQRPLGAPAFRLVVEDQRECPADAGELIRRLINRPLDLAVSPGSATLVRLADREYLFVLTLHHLVTDGWSLARLLEEIALDYQGLPVEGPRVSFRNLASARRGCPDSASEEFWKAEFSGVPSVTELPGDYPRSSTPLHPRGRLSFALPAGLAGRLSESARAQGWTPNSLILTALATAIHRRSGQRDMAMGITYAGRDEASSDTVHGLLMTLLALRVEIADGVSFRELVRQVADRSQRAYAHSDYPFSRLIQQLSIRPEPGRQPLVQIVFAPQAGPRSVLSLPGVEACPLDIDLDATYYDLTCCTWPSAHGLDIDLYYASDLFSEETMREFRDQFLRLLTGALEDPDRPIAELDLLSERERRRIIEEWSGAAETERRRSLPRSGFLEALRQVTSDAGDRDAIRFDGSAITYRELDAWSNRIARALVARNFRRGEIAAISCKASPGAIAAILGVWKAGGAYLPLDPAYPAERLEWMLDDSGASIVISDGSRGDRRLPSLVLDDSIHAFSGAPVEELPAPDAAAYLIYTSGSTGTPKGVLVEHGGVAALVAAVRERYPLPAGSRVLQFVSLSFDASVAELVCALTQGATLVIPVRGHFLGGEELVDFLEAERISQAILPVSVLAQLNPRPLPHLIRIIAGGERCPAAVVDRWGRQTLVVNAYGPTEASVGASAHNCVPGEGDPPIGRPLPGWALYILDAAGRVVPPLTPGELYIGGLGLARGYWRREELTAERFVDDGTPEIRERLYRTGDRARWRRDGAIEFLGRTDGQRKVRGFRVELGEIESALMADSSVQAAAAMVQGEGPAARIIAYVAPREQRGAGQALADSLLTRLRSRLPAPLIPSQVVLLPAMPLTPNGKIDRSALDGAAPLAEGPSPQRSEIETAVAAVWQAILGRPTPFDVNFFDAGGTSLLMVELQMRLEAEFGKRISLADLFANPTMRLVARLIAPESDIATPAIVSNRGIVREQVAIVGMAARFPMAADIDAFWRNLREGREGIKRFSVDELIDGGVPADLARNPEYVPARGVIDDADKFDAAVFDMGAHEAERLDPQQRIWLECALAALEDAGCDPHRFPGSIGVFAGVGSPEYLHQWLASVNKPGAPDYQMAFGNEKDFVATRTSYKLGLRGPSLTLQTACSTSLVAVSVACQSLLSGACDIAVAGAASVGIPIEAGYLFQEGMILSPDGHCRPFDSRAAGTVPADGVGAVILKRLSDAVAAGDDIYAVIAGSAVNNDGDRKVGFTAPGAAGQRDVISRALTQAGISARDVSFVETHGTATPMGDPIEVSALRHVFEEAGAAAGSCVLGSVKSNVGHLNTAAGIAGLVKTALALKHREIPATLHFESPNPEIPLAASPFTVNVALQPWNSERARFAGVSSFGIGGTNAHVILTEAPISARSLLAVSAQGSALSFPGRPGGTTPEVIPISAATATAVEAMARQLADWLEKNPVPLATVARTLQSGRMERRERRAIVASTVAEAVWRLRQIAAGSLSAEPAADNEESRRFEAAGAAWCAGVPTDWSAFLSSNEVPIVHLPSYPFERQRYWALPENRARAARPAPGKASEADWLHVPTWRPAPLPPPGKPVRRWMVFAGDGETGRTLAGRFGDRTVVVIPGSRFSRQAEFEFAVEIDSRDSLKLLFDALRNDPVDGIVHALSLGTDTSLETLEESLSRGYYSVVALVQALAAAGIPDAQLNVLSAGGQAAGAAPSNPLAAAIAGVMRVVAVEHPEWSCRLIDLEGGGGLPEALLLDELRASVDTPVVALRGSKRLTQTYAPANSGFVPAPVLRRNGVYLITGGLGGVGLALAEHLATNYGARLVLASRNPLPPEDQWPSLCKSSQELRRRLDTFRRVRSTAADVTMVAADVADLAQAREMVGLAIGKYGALDGVIHAAGVTGGGALQRRSNETARQILHAKVRGTLALESALSQAPGAFLFLCSSLTAVAGTFGQADYTAANAFQDAFAEKTNSPARRVVSVNWDGWLEVGSYARHVESAAGVARRAHPLLDAWEPEVRQGAYRTDLLADRWIVAEHRVAGDAMVPGTVYLELACAVARERGVSFPMAVRELVLLSPCVLPPGESSALYTSVSRKDGGLEIRIESRSVGGAWQLHAQGSVGPASGDVCDANLDGEIFSASRPFHDTVMPSRGYIDFGPRWACRAWTQRHAGGYLGGFRLPAAFAGEAADFILHPALFDTLSSVVPSEEGEQFLPFSYSDVTVFSPMGAEVLAFAEKNGAHVTIRVAQRDGRLVATVGDYALRPMSLAMAMEER